MNRRTFLVGIIFVTTGCVTNGLTGASKITGENLTKSRELKYGPDKDSNLPKASFNQNENKVTITTVLGVAACNKAVIKQSTYDSETGTLTVKLGDTRQDNISSDAGCGGAVARDVYTAIIILQDSTTPETVVIKFGGQETSIDDLNAEAG